jgi:hypothetical protein
LVKIHPKGSNAKPADRTKTHPRAIAFLSPKSVCLCGGEVCSFRILSSCEEAALQCASLQMIVWWMLGQ